MKSDNTKGNPNHDSLGRFSSSPSDSAAKNTGVDSSSDTATATMPNFSWMKKKGQTTTSQFSWMKKKGQGSEDNAQKKNSLWEQVKKERWWKSRELHDVQYVVDNIDKYYDDDM